MWVLTASLVLLTRIDILIREGDILDAVILINGEGSIDRRDDDRSVLVSLGCVQNRGKMHDRNLVEARGLSGVALA